MSALVHTAIDSFKLVAIPAAALSTFPLLLIVVGLIVPLLAFAFRDDSSPLIARVERSTQQGRW
ncbi:MAG: hypothetical protein ACRDTG_24840 [Pseudonocardiaceae bacterium]